MSRRLQYLAVVGPLGYTAAWLFVLPVLWTQVSWISGLRSRKLEWRPTQKPRYDARVPFAEGTSDAGAASTLHLEVN